MNDVIVEWEDINAKESGEEITSDEILLVSLGVIL